MLRVLTTECIHSLLSQPSKTLTGISFSSLLIENILQLISHYTDYLLTCKLSLIPDLLINT